MYCDLRETARFDEICADAGMKNKGWTYTGDESDSTFDIGDSEADDVFEKILGLSWSSPDDYFRFKVVLRFKINSVEVEITCVAQLLLC